VLDGMRAVVRRPMLRVLSMGGVILGIPSLILALLAMRNIAIAMTWGMVSLSGFGLSVLCVLYAMDTPRNPKSNGAATGQLRDL